MRRVTSLIAGGRPALRLSALLSLLAIAVLLGTGSLLSGGGGAAAPAPGSTGAPAGVDLALVVGEAGRADPAAPAEPYSRTLDVGKGDTLMALLVKAGIDRGDAHNAITAMRPVYNPRRLKPGQQIVVTFAPPPDGSDDARFLGLVLEAEIDRAIQVSRLEDGGYAASEEKRPLARVAAGAAGTIQSSLFVDAIMAGLPVPVLVEMIRAFSYDVDFQRDIQPGDRFEALYEDLRNASGETVGQGDLLYARLTLSGADLAVFRYTTAAGATDYFDAKGQSVRKALMRTPIDGARLSSGFGKRTHPILGYSRLHAGVDFAAPTGTPIYAAGDGVVDFAGPQGDNGNYVRIRHNSEYSTAYAHASRFARGLRRGIRVKQGQVVAYVGTTGLSTGPHLHYEVMRQGRKVNPMSVKLPAGERLRGADLAHFAERRADLDRRFAETARTETLAGASR
ncbi:MAG: peptidoglycan DD-metalloendopeptidase family protein [Proteobacteria bacterium]|nr:peptidoglycan DD-metalloendopeptidase family protein [Pseudomonadota bacterium]